MFWEEDTATKETEVPTDVVDLLFSIECRELPVDHAHSLSRALSEALPWIAEDPRVGVHQIHVAASQNGWERPPPGGEQLLCLSRRTKLTMRVPADRLDAARQLTGKTLDVAGHRLKVGPSKTRALSKQGIIFSRYVVAHQGEEEEQFLHRMAAELRTLGIPIKKALCGKETAFDTPEGTVFTRSLLLADLTPEHSLRLQREGLGPHREMGCGIFIPHKGIDPVKKQEDDSK